MVGKREEGWWKKKEVYFGKFYFNGRHYFTVIGDENTEEDLIKDFSNHYTNIFKIADRPYWNFSLQKFKDDLLPFSQSQLFEDMWYNFGGGGCIEFHEENKNFNLKVGRVFRLTSEGERCKVTVEPKVVSENNWKPYTSIISRDCGELFLAIIRECVANLGKSRKWSVLPHVDNTCCAFINASFQNWSVNPRSICLDIMEEIEKKGDYSQLYKIRYGY